MTDDQATLGSFAGSDDADEGGEDRGDAADTGEAGRKQAPAGDTAAGEGETSVRPDPAESPSDDLVCPWCLAPSDEFAETGPTGLACGRCSGTLPADAAWFRDRDVIARRPMYEVDSPGTD